MAQLDLEVQVEESIKPGGYCRELVIRNHVFEYLGLDRPVDDPYVAHASDLIDHLFHGYSSRSGLIRSPILKEELESRSNKARRQLLDTNKCCGA